MTSRRADGTHHLDYASPRVGRGGRPLFRPVLGLFAAAGIAANLAFIGLSTRQLHRAHWAYHDLMQNPRAYGREVEPAIIASLREPHALWTAFGAFGAASAFGLFLAIHLLLAVAGLDRSPGPSDRRLSQYRRWKPLGIALTAVTFFWAENASLSFWAAATQHISVGSSPPIFATATLVACALLPWWWIGEGVRTGD